MIKNKKNIIALENKINNLPNIDQFKNNIRYTNKKIDLKTSLNISTSTFAFIDPFGYQGVTIDLLASILKEWGSDVILFFNYNRIYAAINNANVENHMRALFTDEVYLEIYDIIKNRMIFNREDYIINKFIEAINKKTKAKSFPFSFDFEHKNRTSHYLIFISANDTAINIMKDIMTQYSKKAHNNIALYKFKPYDNETIQLSFFDTEAINILKNDLLTYFQNKNISVENIIKVFSTKKYSSRNIKDALLSLEEDELIVCQPSAKSRKIIKGQLTMGANTIICFPKQ